MRKYQLDAEEKEILEALESGKINPLSNSAAEKLRLQKIVQVQKAKTKTNNSRLFAKVR